MAVIYPKLGQESRVAKILLSLSDHPRDVSTTTESGLAFVVPDDLYQRYLAYEEPKEQTPAMVGQERRRPGRPRKVVTPDTESEQ